LIQYSGWRQVSPRPPSTASTCPVTQAAGSASRTIQSATSPGSPPPAERNARGLLGLDLRDDRLGQPGGGQRAALGRAGRHAFTRMPSGASSSAQLRVSCSIAAFVAA